MLVRGDHVKIQGFAGKEGELVVWEVREKGLMLCTDEGYQSLIEGREAPVIGFPLSDIVGPINEPKKP